MMHGEALRAPVVCYRETLERLGGNEALYERMLRKVPDDPTLAQAQAALKDHNRADFALYIHALRGLALNLGFAALAEPAQQIDSHLRQEGYSDADFSRDEPMLAQKLASLCERYEAVLQMLQQALGE